MPSGPKNAFYPFHIYGMLVYSIATKSSLTSDSAVRNPLISSVCFKERHPASPMTHALPAPIYSLARRRPVRPACRRCGNYTCRSRGLSIDGSTVPEAHLSERERKRVWQEPGRHGVNSDVHKHESAVTTGLEYLNDVMFIDDVSRIKQAKGDRGGGFKAVSSVDEAWSATGTTSTWITERMHREYSNGGASGGQNGGIGVNESTREAMSVANVNIWAWNEAGKGDTGEKAMITAYDPQGDRHYPTCSRRTAMHGASLYCRRQQSQCNCERQVTLDNAAIDQGRCNHARETGLEESLTSTGANPSNRGTGGNARTGAQRSEMIVESISHSHKRRLGEEKRRKQKFAVSMNRPPPGCRYSEGYSCPSEWAARVCNVRQRKSGDGGKQTSTPRTRTSDCKKGARKASNTSSGPCEKLHSPDHEQGDFGFSEHIQQDFDDRLAPPGSAATVGLSSSPFQHTNGHSRTAVVISKDGTLLSMDGRGGSAAPLHLPHRPTECLSAAASHSLVLPELFAGSMGPGLMATFDADGGTEGRSANSTIGRDHGRDELAFRHRLPSHNSWEIRKHPRPFSGCNRGGTISSGSHSCRDQKQSLSREQRQGSDDKMTSPLPGVGILVNTSMMDDSASGTETTHGTVNCPGAVPYIAFGCSMNPLGDEQGLADKQQTSTDSGECALLESNVDATPTDVATGGGLQQDCILDPHEATEAREINLDSIERLLPASFATKPYSELIDHFRAAPRPASRRGTRQDGTGGQEATLKLSMFNDRMGAADDTRCIQRRKERSRAQVKETASHEQCQQ